MSRMIVLLSVVILLFGLAAGGSWYLQSMQNKEKEGEAPKAEEKPAKSHAPGKNASFEGPAKSLIRPAATNDTERLTQLASALQQQKDQLELRTKEIGVREKQMDIVHAEIKKEHKKLEALRKEIQVELANVQEKLDLLDKRTADGNATIKTIAAAKAELAEKVTEYDTQELANIKAQIKTFEKMDPEAAASVITEMSNSGKLDTAVKILAQMRDRQAAAIFAELAKDDTKLPSQIFGRMLTLRQPPVIAPKN